MEFREDQSRRPEVGTPTQISNRFTDRLLSIALSYPVETMITSAAFGQLAGSVISFASGNKDAAFRQALAATITQLASTGILVADIAIRKRFKK